MVDRSANATIKGYFYQFDYAILKALEADDEDKLVVEGIEDVDISSAIGEEYVQCKYYEGTEYNHSVIKDAVQFMAKHYAKVAATGGKLPQYRIYAHYKSGHEKLTKTTENKALLNVDFVKQNFLTYFADKIQHKVHEELGLNDQALQTFVDYFTLDIWAKNFSDQYNQIKQIAALHLRDCEINDFEKFFYPNAINFIRERAIEKEITRRSFTRKEFLIAIDKKQHTFNKWLFEYKGREKYIEAAKKENFTFYSTTLPKAARIFILEDTKSIDIDLIIEFLNCISWKYSHAEKVRTVDVDRFCPYVYLHEIEGIKLVSIKHHAKRAGIKFIDGHDFKGADFSLESIMRWPTKENLWKLKIISTELDLRQVINAAHNCPIEVFHFYSLSKNKFDFNFNQVMVYKPIGVDHFKSILKVVA